MSVEKILMQNGEYLRLDEACSFSSNSLFQSRLHYEVCELIARKYQGSLLLRKIIENLYSSKSHRVRVITALVWFVEQYNDDIDKIYVFEDIFEVLTSRGLCKDAVTVIGPWGSEYIDRKHYRTLILKVFVNRLYRLFSRPIPKGSIIIRGWVEVTEAMYSAVLESAELRIYPFPFGVKRQTRFILDCRRKKYRMSLDGLPYSVGLAVRLFFLKSGGDEALALIELKAYQAYAKKLLRINPKSIYTSDEFEAGGVALYTPLIQAGVSVTNTAHGVGLYCPHVAYTDFLGFSLSQGGFYASRNTNISVRLRSHANVVLPLQVAKDVVNFPPVFVLIHQNFEDYGYQVEEEILYQIARKVSKVSLASNVKYFVKLHPNLPSGLAAEVSRKLGATPILKWEGLCGFRPVFITINSTTFFDTRGFGPTLVYNGPSFFPELYFGKNFLGFSIDNLSQQLSDLIQPQKWLEASFCHAKVEA